MPEVRTARAEYTLELHEFAEQSATVCELLHRMPKWSIRM